jgi:glycosyltransferase involved in cell wall biosynthesis
VKPLTAKQKDFLYREVAFGKFRWFSKPLYDLLMGMELLWHRIEDFFHGKDDADVSSLTAVIKTFERPYAVKRLVKSIRRRYPDLKIIVVDDSRVPGEIEGVHTIAMPYNIGISMGRNRALQETDTPYFLLLDDDFVFSHRQRLGELVAFMDRHSEVDILGGHYIDLLLYIEHKFHDMPVFESAQVPKITPGTKIENHVVVNKVQIYLIVRTSPIRDFKWKDELKILEHTDFFPVPRGSWLPQTTVT